MKGGIVTLPPALRERKVGKQGGEEVELYIREGGGVFSNEKKGIHRWG